MFTRQTKPVEILRYLGVIFIAFGLIYGSRFYLAKKASRCSSLCKYGDNSSELNENFFNEMVRPLIRDDRRFNLIIFLDPAKECPVCLYETEFWLSPLDRHSDFMVHFFFPRQTNQETLRGYLNAFNLSEDQINYFDIEGPLQDLVVYGLVKIFYDRENGLCWYEFGNSSEADQQKFFRKLDNTLSLQ